jgi:putative spermidine/putrescine transport system ATP-binding protein
VYNSPRTAFVAQFLGESNLLKATVMATSVGGTTLRTAEGWLLVGSPATDNGLPEGAEVTISLRPERLKLSRQTRPTNSIRATVVERTFLGASVRLLLEADHERRLTVVAPEDSSGHSCTVGEACFCIFEPEDVVVLRH